VDGGCRGGQGRNGVTWRATGTWFTTLLARARRGHGPVVTTIGRGEEVGGVVYGRESFACGGAPTMARGGRGRIQQTARSLCLDQRLRGDSPPNLALQVMISWAPMNR